MATEEEFYKLIQLTLELAEIFPERRTVTEIFGDEIADKMGIEESEVYIKHDDLEDDETYPIYDVFAFGKREREEDIVNGLRAKDVIAFCSKINEMCGHIMTAIENEEEAPSFCSVAEFLLLSLRITIINDHWFEYDEETGPRSPFTNFTFLLFFLQMHYRLWRRAKLILDQPSEDSEFPPVWCKTSDFVNGAYFLVMEDTSTNEDPDSDVVINWLPERVYKALGLLMRSRNIGSVNLETFGARRLFTDYRNALIDRVALFTVLQTEGLPEQLTTDKTNWFRLETTKTDTDLLQDTAYAAIAKRIRESIDNETRRVIKEQCMEVEFNVESAFETIEDIYNRVMRDNQMSEVEAMACELETLKNRLRLIRINPNDEKTAAQRLLDEEEGDYGYVMDDEEEAAAQLEEQILIRNIEDLEKLFETVKKNLQEQQDAEREERLEMFTDIIGFKVRSKAGTLSYSMATEKYMAENMFLVDHVLSWQMPEPNSIRIYEESFNLKCRRLFQAVCKFSLNGAEKLCMDAEKWIITHSVTLAEREAYRFVVSAHTRFTTHSIVSARRHADEPTLKAFPKSPEVILSNPNHPYYHEFVAYICWYYLYQTLPKVSIDSTIFFWNAEDEYLSLQRCEPFDMAITRIGDRWVLLKGDTWENGKDGINGTWFGTDILPCLVTYLTILGEHEWKLRDRINGSIINISGTRIRDLFKELTTPRTGTSLI